MRETILSLLPGDYPWADRLEYVPRTDSTNTRLKEAALRGAPHGTALIAGAQTGGRGRMGRSFQSPEGAGVYLSMLLRPDCAPGELMHLTCAVAQAMCPALEKVSGIRPGIKWTNDLVYGKRKLGGILTELGFSSQGRVDHCIIGIGINCLQQEGDLPESIRDFAGSLSMVSGKTVSPAHTAAAMLEALWKMDDVLLKEKAHILRAYRENCVTLGQEISLLRSDMVRHGKALDITDDGALIVEFSDGHTETVNSGEVSIRGMYGYL